MLKADPLIQYNISLNANRLGSTGKQTQQGVCSKFQIVRLPSELMQFTLCPLHYPLGKIVHSVSPLELSANNQLLLQCIICKIS